MTADDLTKMYHDTDCEECGAKAGERCLSPKGRQRSVPHNERVQRGTDRFQRGTA